MSLPASDVGTSAPPAPWTAKVLTLFPEMFPGPLGHSLAGKGLAADLWRLEATDIRGFATDRHRTVDDAPFGGGVGLVMKPDVLDAALAATVPTGWPLVYLTPRGAPLTQKRVRDLAAGPGLAVLCGRYEGVDQRVLDHWAPIEICLGDFVLSGGEPAALCLIDACVRLLPGVMGKEEGHLAESFENGLLEHPCYTRPAEWRGRAVPAALLSGHHENIRAWRRAESERATRERRPDLWRRHQEAAGQKIVVEGSLT